MGSHEVQDRKELVAMALNRAYCCNYGEGVAACLLRCCDGRVFVGASVALEMGPLQPGSLSPVTVALVSMAANARNPEEIEQVDWVSGPVAQVEALRCADQELLAQVAPNIR